MDRVKGRPWRRRFCIGVSSLTVIFLTFSIFIATVSTQEHSSGVQNGYDGYEDPDADEFDNVRIVYGEEYNGVLPQTGPCSDYKPGEDDLQAFDFIRKFRLDILEGEVAAITRVRGSDRLQTAYKLDKQIDLTRDTREIFPQGLPEQFSFMTTWRTRKPPKVPWHIIAISDFLNRTQFAITLNPRPETVEFSILDYEKKLQTLVFRNVDVFDKNWHKLHFGVFRDRVLLYADCEEIGSEALEVRSPVDVNGRISMAKLRGGTGETVPIDLQWMVLNCDPTRPEREACDELPPKSPSEPSSTTTPRPPIPVVPGPPGPKGDRGDRGFPGIQGLPGTQGIPVLPIEPTPVMGPPGPRGFQGFAGEKGETGSRGDTGQKGEPGDRGIPGYGGGGGSGYGLPGPPGERGASGERGPPGANGLPGIPGGSGSPGAPGINGQRGLPGIGLPGTPGRSFSENELRDICASVLRDRMEELTRNLIGPPGRPGVGKPGIRGLTGPQGIPGDPGRQGQEGSRGFSGLPGVPGPRGPEGPKGERGDIGIQGPEGVGIEGPAGPPGLQGLQGPPGIGLIGRPGERGLPGPRSQGPKGEQGLTGSPGYCEFCNYPGGMAYGPLGSGGTKKGPPSGGTKKGR